jgi:hypothetical protein
MLWLVAFLSGTAACVTTRQAPVTSSPSSSTAGIIGQLKAFEPSLGMQPTGNFLKSAESDRAIHRCYFTGIFELPDSYRGLHLVNEDEAHCRARADSSDVFFYPIEAVATGSAPITQALTNATLERMLVVVAHEDFHNQPEAQQASPERAEAAATLAGFVAASAFAEQKFGADSTTSQGLRREAQLYLQKSTVVNDYYDKLSDLYASRRAGSISPADTVVRKSQLFNELRTGCLAITPDPVSFNKCPAALNNAGLAFDRTYTKDYPAMYASSDGAGDGARSAVLNLKRLLASSK